MAHPPSPRLVATALTLEERLDLEMNDEDNAARILSAFGDDLVYVQSKKSWAVWDGTRYSFRSANLAARQIAHRLRQLVMEEADYLQKNFEASDDEVEDFIAAMGRKRPPVFVRTAEDALNMMGFAASAKLRAHATKCGNIARVKNALEVCEHQRRAEVDDMDSNPFVLTCPNGDLDLRAAMKWTPDDKATYDDRIAAWRSWLGPVDRANLPTKCAGVDFDPTAECPEWEDFMELILPDHAIRDCVQRCLGATLFGENRAQICLILRGPGGNGKSTLLNTLSHVLGNRDGYAAACKIEMFLETGMAQASAATPDEVMLPGARAYIATEPGARDVLSAKKIKGLTGGDRRISRANYGDFFEWVPRGVPLLSCNRTPKIKDEDEGTRRRLVFIPFDVNLRALPVEKQRSQGEVESALRAEGSGVLNWLLDGFRAFMDQGVNPPPAMVTLKNTLLESADPVGVFLDQMTVKETSGRLSVSVFYKVHEKWCEEEGRQLYQMKTVGDVMVEKGFERGPVRGRSHWKGLRWSDAAADMVQAVTGERPQARPPEDEGDAF